MGRRHTSQEERFGRRAREGRDTKLGFGPSVLALTLGSLEAASRVVGRWV